MAKVITTTSAIKKAFEQWETAYRANPDHFFTAEETAKMEVGTVADRQAIYFGALLREVSKKTK